MSHNFLKSFTDTDARTHANEKLGGRRKDSPHGHSALALTSITNVIPVAVKSPTSVLTSVNKRFRIEWCNNPYKMGDLYTINLRLVPSFQSL